MAWSIEDYNVFLDVAQDTFGIERDEAQELYREMRDDFGDGLTVYDLYEYGDVAAEIVGEMLEEYEEPEVEPVDYEDLDMDDYQEMPYEELPDLGYDEYNDWDDEWLDAGEEIEITAEVAYEEGKT